MASFIFFQIPVFPALLKLETVSMVGSVVPNKPFDGDKMTLLEWISSRGSSQSLEQLADSCYRSLQQMDPELLTDLKSKVLTAIEHSQNSQMKEIRGLGKLSPTNMGLGHYRYDNLMHLSPL
jgi:hypothetical protein